MWFSERLAKQGSCNTFCIISGYSNSMNQQFEDYEPKVIGSFSLSCSLVSPDTICWREFAKEDENNEGNNDDKGGSSILGGVDAMGEGWMEGGK